MSRLVVVYSQEASLRGKQFALGAGTGTQPLRVGRASDNEIVLCTDSASRHHARFERRDDGWWVVDVGSTNGIFVNDAQAWPGCRLENGDRIKISVTVFEIAL